MFIISGTLEHDKRLEILAREELQGYESRVPITYLTDLSPDELVAKTKSLPARSIVLYVWQQSRNEQGKVLESADMLALIARSATVPIYGMTSPNVGGGIVGGYVNTAEASGSRVAEIALRDCKRRAGARHPGRECPDCTDVRLAPASALENQRGQAPARQHRPFQAADFLGAVQMAHRWRACAVCLPGFADRGSAGSASQAPVCGRSAARKPRTPGADKGFLFGDDHARRS